MEGRALSRLRGRSYGVAKARLGYYLAAWTPRRASLQNSVASRHNRQGKIIAIAALVIGLEGVVTHSYGRAISQIAEGP